MITSSFVPAEIARHAEAIGPDYVALAMLWDLPNRMYLARHEYGDDECEIREIMECLRQFERALPYLPKIRNEASDLAHCWYLASSKFAPYPYDAYDMSEATKRAVGALLRINENPSTIRACR